MLIISLCRYKLHEEEFVRPVVEVAKSLVGISNIKVVNVSDEKYIRTSKEKVAIICGTALKDFNYRKINFSWIENFNFLLGICAGYQVIAKKFSAKLSKARMIGVYTVNCLKDDPILEHMDTEFRSYFLHSLSLDLSIVPSSLDVLALCKNKVAIFKVKDKNYYGVSFHPEVLNPEIIKNFIKLSYKKL